VVRTIVEMLVVCGLCGVVGGIRPPVLVLDGYLRRRLLHKPLKNLVHQLVSGITEVRRPAFAPAGGIGPPDPSILGLRLPPSLQQ
jgi:hypothetical protein